MLRIKDGFPVAWRRSWPTASIVPQAANATEVYAGGCSRPKGNPQQINAAPGLGCVAKVSAPGFGCGTVTADGQWPDHCGQTKSPHQAQQERPQRGTTSGKCPHGLNRRRHRLELDQWPHPRRQHFNGRNTRAGEHQGDGRHP